MAGAENLETTTDTSLVIARQHPGYLVKGGVFAEMPARIPRLDLDSAVNRRLGQIVTVAAAAAELNLPFDGGPDPQDSSWRLRSARNMDGGDPSPTQVALARKTVQTMMAPPFWTELEGDLRALALDFGFRYPGDALAYASVFDTTLPTDPEGDLSALGQPPEHPHPDIPGWYYPHKK